MKPKSIILLILFLALHSNSKSQVLDDNRAIGIFTQQLSYRFTIIEFKSNLTFNYHIMSERTNRQTSGKYKMNGDTIILNSYSTNTDFDFKNKKWIMLSRRQIVLSNNKDDKKELCYKLKKSKHFDSIPEHRSSLSLKVDSMKINELSWRKDTTNYDLELKLIIHEPESSKEPLIVIDSKPIKYDFFLNFYDLKDIESIKAIKGDKYLNLYGSRATSGVILIETKKNANMR